jgi:hypothetical protein
VETTGFHRLGRYVREHLGTDIVVLASDDDLSEYEGAVEAFAHDGDRSTLLRRLLALGLTAGQVRWHAMYRGEYMVTMY